MNRPSVKFKPRKSILDSSGYKISTQEIFVLDTPSWIGSLYHEYRHHWQFQNLPFYILVWANIGLSSTNLYLISANNNFFGRLRQFFIAISPLIGMCTLVWFFPNYFVLCYIGFSFQMFFMSEVDIHNAGYNLQIMYDLICKLFTQHNTRK